MSKNLSNSRTTFIASLDGRSISLQIVMVVAQTLGIDMRKHLINTVQAADMTLSKPLDEHLPYYLNCRRPHGIRLTKKEFLEALRIVLLSPISRSMVWTLAKSCPEPKDDDQSLSVRIAGFNKELSATQKIFRMDPVYNYNKPKRGDTRHFVPCTEMAKRFTERINARQSVIFPCVNRKKNIARNTALQYQYYCDKPLSSIRSVDLELLWREQGIKVGGISEMRETWKLNELKPRFYFCQGGDSYWAARHIKPIVVALLESIAATKKDVRLKLPHSLNFNVNLDTVMIWDYTSFSSSLSELKFFMNRLIDLVPEGLTVLTFDYRHGKSKTYVKSLLEDYNRMINVESSFSVERIDPELRQDIFVLSEFLGMNSGLLGTNGNIGFSMALHGLVIDSIDGQGRRGCSIGDDAIKITQDPDHVISVMIQLGELHPDKFGQIFDTGTLRFMKRRLWIDEYGNLQIDKLVAFPAFSIVDDEKIGTRTTGCYSEEERIFKLAGQIADAWWSFPSINHLLDEDDRNLATAYFRQVYKTLQFPFQGAHQGTFLRSRSYRLPFAIPPISDDCFTTPWHEVLVEQDPGSWAEINLKGIVELKRIPEKGDHFVWNESQFASALEDMEIISQKSMTEVIYCSTVANRVRIKRAYNAGIAHDPQMISVTMLKEMPPEFRSMFSIRTGFVDTGMEHML